MVRQLQSRKASRTLHIALFLVVMLCTTGSVSAQSALLPGDIAFVSVNSQDNSFEFVPLITLEKETTLFFSNARWMPDSQGFDADRSLMVILQNAVEAGTVIRYDGAGVAGAWTDGQIRLSDASEVLYAYQIDSDAYEFLTAVAWGEASQREEKLTGLPALFDEHKDLLVQLGDHSNYQYYLRNGASGTEAMLRKMLTHAGNWRGHDHSAYHSLSTSFSLMKPPVILFDGSISNVGEWETQATLKVAIYEHDGSKLTVDVEYDSVYSSLPNADLDHYFRQQINFTGLIGDAIYEIEIPVADNKEYQGLRTATFNLRNLSQGHFGDFVSHTLVVQDDELPALQPDLIDAGSESFVVIHNLENVPVDLSGWTLSKGRELVEFPEGTLIPSTRYLAVFGYNSVLAESEPSQKVVLNEERADFLQKAGTIRLMDPKGNTLNEIRIRAPRQQDGVLVARSAETDQSNLENRFTTEESGNLSSGDDLVNEPVGSEGWKKLSAENLDDLQLDRDVFFRWNSVLQRFESFNGITAGEEEAPLLLGFMNQEQATSLLKLSVDESRAKETQQVFEFVLAAEDVNGDGGIDRLEGLNPEFNASGQFLPYEWMTAAIGEDLAPRIYVWDIENNRTRNIRAGEGIPPESWFFVEIRQPLDAKKIVLDPSDYSSDLLNRDDPEKPEGSFTLELTGQGFRRDITVNFRPEEAGQLQPQNSLEGLTEIKLPGEAYAAFYLDTGNDWYETLELGTEASNSSGFDLDMIASRSGEYKLQIRNWDRVPQDWIVLLEDKLEEREYILDKNWSFEFDYDNGLNANQRHELDDPPRPYGLDRFQLTLMSREKYFSREEVDLPLELDLHQNYPNPFNPATTISFYLPDDAEVRLSVFNIVGQPVAVLVNGTMSSGEHTVEWDATNMPSGMYIYQLEVGARVMTRKMTLVK